MKYKNFFVYNKSNGSGIGAIYGFNDKDMEKFEDDEVYVTSSDIVYDSYGGELEGDYELEWIKYIDVYTGLNNLFKVIFND